MMSNYQKHDDFDIYWIKKLIFIQVRNNLIFIKKSPWTPMYQSSPVCGAMVFRQTLGQPYFQIQIKNLFAFQMCFDGPKNLMCFDVRSIKTHECQIAETLLISIILNEWAVRSNALLMLLQQNQIRVSFVPQFPDPAIKNECS